MTIDCFREAVASVAEWPGIVAMFGGNPCCHPQFEEFCDVLASMIPPRRRGLWTDDLMSHGAKAAETFRAGRLNLNAHADARSAAEIEKWFPGRLIKGSDTKPSWHSPVFMDRRDFGVSDADWERARENCDINRDWSGLIKQGPDGRPYAYFCEVAASLDGVRGENHGILAVPGWWRNGMDGFGDQVAQCCDRGCGVPLRRRGHLDVDDTYDVSRSWDRELPIPRGQVAVKLHTEMPEGTELATDYQGRWTDKAKVTA